MSNFDCILYCKYKTYIIICVLNLYEAEYNCVIMLKSLNFQRHLNSYCRFPLFQAGTLETF